MTKQGFEEDGAAQPQSIQDWNSAPKQGSAHAYSSRASSVGPGAWAWEAGECELGEGMVGNEAAIAWAFQREYSIRRVLQVLAIKQYRIQDELRHLGSHIALLVPGPSQTPTHPQDAQEILEEALGRLGNPAFTALLLETLSPSHRA